MAIAATDTGRAHVELVRRGYAAFNAGDTVTLAELFDEDSSWHTPGQSPIAGDYLGRDAVLGQFGRYGGDTAGTFSAELLSVAATADGRVVGIHRNTGERNGKRLDAGCCVVFEIRNGKIVDGREHFFDLHTWDEFWS